MFSQSNFLCPPIPSYRFRSSLQVFLQILPPYHTDVLLLPCVLPVMEPELPEDLSYQTDPAYIAFINLDLSFLYKLRSELDAVIRRTEDNDDPTAPSPPAEPNLNRVGPSTDPSPLSDSIFHGVGPSTVTSRVQLPTDLLKADERSYS